jgi:hypothetical protein
MIATLTSQRPNEDQRVATADYDATTNTIGVITSWNMKPLIKQAPGARWDSTQKLWRVPASWASLVGLRGLFGDQLEVGDKLKDWSWRVHNERIGPSLDARMAMELIDDGSPEAEVIKSWRT